MKLSPLSFLIVIGWLVIAAAMFAPGLALIKIFIALVVLALLALLARWLEQ